MATIKVTGVEGLTKFNRYLKQADAEAVKEMKKVNTEISKMVAEAARAKAHSLGGVAAKSADAVKSSSSASAIAVIISKTAHPYAFGAEFGAKKYAQFDEWRGSRYVDAFEGTAGRFLYPTIRDKEQEVKDKWLEGAKGILETRLPGVLS